MNATRRLVLASANIHKLAELAGLIAAAGLPFTVLAARELGSAPTIAEDQDSFVAHAALKARGIAAWLASLGEPGDTLVLADDSGICIDALGGRPGVDSAIFAGPDADDDANNAKVVAALAKLGLDSSPAHYVCVLAVRRVDGKPPGRSPAPRPTPVPDRISRCSSPTGTGRSAASAAVHAGFGYDPHFFVDGEARSGQRRRAEPGREERPVARAARPSAP